MILALNVATANYTQLYVPVMPDKTRHLNTVEDCCKEH